MNNYNKPILIVQVEKDDITNPQDLQRLINSYNLEEKTGEERLNILTEIEQKKENERKKLFSNLSVYEIYYEISDFFKDLFSGKITNDDSDKNNRRYIYLGFFIIILTVLINML